MIQMHAFKRVLNRNSEPVCVSEVMNFAMYKIRHRYSTIDEIGETECERWGLRGSVVSAEGQLVGLSAVLIS